jgi:hypothetical protein
MSVVKLICDGCGVKWGGDPKYIDTVHTVCKVKGSKWRQATAADFEQAKVAAVKALKPQSEADKFATEKTVTNAYTLNWHSLVWNKGGIKGWAVVGVEGYRDVFAELKPHYADRLYTVIEDVLRKEVQQGKTFVLDPIGVVELLLHQLSRHPAENVPPELCEHLLEAQRLLVQMRDGFTPPATWTTHTEAIDTTNSVTSFFMED